MNLQLPSISQVRRSYDFNSKPFSRLDLRGMAEELKIQLDKNAT
jgi:hypothetical protein